MTFHKIFNITLKVWLSLLLLNGSLIVLFLAGNYLYQISIDYNKKVVADKVRQIRDQEVDEYLNSNEFKAKVAEYDSIQNKNIEILKQRGELK